MTQGSYRQFCPVAMAAETLCTRWTLVVVRELLAGSTRFNELRRGVPRMSPALLSQRLKELEAAGVLDRLDAGAGGAPEYRLTESGRELGPLVSALGNWGQRWIESEVSLTNLDVQLLMWDMRRGLNPEPRRPRQRSPRPGWPAGTGLGHAELAGPQSLRRAAADGQLARGGHEASSMPLRRGPRLIVNDHGGPRHGRRQRRRQHHHRSRSAL